MTTRRLTELPWPDATVAQAVELDYIGRDFKPPHYALIGGGKKAHIVETFYAGSTRCRTRCGQYGAVTSALVSSTLCRVCRRWLEGGEP